MKEPILEPILRRFRLARVVPHIPKQATLLDIGCGTQAALLRHIAPQLHRGFGVDFKVTPFETDNLKVQQITLAGTLPFADRTFDVVTMLAVLEHIEQEQDILQDIHRVLVPGGTLVLTVPSVWAQPVLEFLAYRAGVISAAEIRDHKRYYNRQTLHQALIQGAGFENFQHQYFQLWMNNFCTVSKGRV